TLVVGLCRMVFYGVLDDYKVVSRVYRLLTFMCAFVLSLIEVMLLFFACFIDFFFDSVSFYFGFFFSLFITHFFITFFFRIFWLTRCNRFLKAGKVSFNTIIIGGNENALELYREIESREMGLGYRFIGFVDANGKSSNILVNHIPK